MEHIHQILKKVSTSFQREVLATILHVEGSSYRKAGTSMLLGEDETKVGLLSAGCLEVDLAARVKDIFNRGIPEIVVYNMNTIDEISWGEASRCNGVITVLLEPINPSLHKHMLTHIH